jgi:hypothetical protein
MKKQDPFMMYVYAKFISSVWLEVTPFKPRPKLRDVYAKTRAIIAFDKGLNVGAGIENR